MGCSLYVTHISLCSVLVYDKVVMVTFGAVSGNGGV